jgi:hypothetical protein
MKRLIAGLLIIILLLGVVACATPESPTIFSSDSEEQYSLSEFLVVSEKGGDDSFTHSYGESSGMVPPATTMTITAPMPTTPAPAPDIGNGSVSFERMIVRTGDMYLVVEDVAVSLEQIAQLA